MNVPTLVEARQNLVQALVEGGDVEFNYALAVLSLRRAVSGEGYGADDEVEAITTDAQARLNFEQLEAAVALCRTIPQDQVKGLGGLLRPLHERHEADSSLQPAAAFLRQNAEQLSHVTRVDKVRLYAQRLDELGNAPDGDDFNEVLRLLGI